MPGGGDTDADRRPGGGQRRRPSSAPWWSGRSAEVAEVGRPGSLLGVMADIELFEQTCELGPGDALVLFTDGITERRQDGRALR